MTLDSCSCAADLVVKAVLDAMAIMEDCGVSIKTFEDILEYGKTMLLTFVGDDVDVDILSALWPKNWNAVQSLPKKEGFDDVKEYYICICRENKTFTRSGKTHKIRVQPQMEHHGKQG